MCCLQFVTVEFNLSHVSHQSRYKYYLKERNKFIGHCTVEEMLKEESVSWPTAVNVALEGELARFVLSVSIWALGGESAD